VFGLTCWTILVVASRPPSRPFAPDRPAKTKTL